MHENFFPNFCHVQKKKKKKTPDHSIEKLIDILKNNVKYSSEPPNHYELNGEKIWDKLSFSDIL